MKAASSLTRSAIILTPDARLSQRSSRISRIDEPVRQLVADMINATLDWENHRAHETGAAMAAIQIGVARQVVIIREDFGNKANQNFIALINPKIVKLSGSVEFDMEGCLSVCDHYGRVPRHSRVKVEALNLDGKTIRFNATGFLARVLQHEIDHTEGRLFTDRLLDPRGDLYSIEPDGSLKPVAAKISK